ncbi:MAG: hypothetical protein ACK5M4_01070 [Pseudorhodobacter sp.]
MNSVSILGLGKVGALAAEPPNMKPKMVNTHDIYTLIQGRALTNLQTFA